MRPLLGLGDDIGHDRGTLVEDGHGYALLSRAAAHTAASASTSPWQGQSRPAPTAKDLGVQHGEVLERDLAGADAPPQVTAVTLDDLGAAPVAADDPGIAPSRAAIDADKAVDLAVLLKPPAQVRSVPHVHDGRHSLPSSGLPERCTPPALTRRRQGLWTRAAIRICSRRSQTARGWEDAEVQHRYPVRAGDPDAHAGAAPNRAGGSPRNHRIDRRACARAEQDRGVPGVKAPCRGRAAVPGGMQAPCDGEATLHLVRRERAAVGPCVPTVTRPGQEQGPAHGLGPRGECRVGPGGAAAVQVPAPVCEPGGHHGHGLQNGGGRGARSDAGVDELSHGVLLPLEAAA